MKPDSSTYGESDELVIGGVSTSDLVAEYGTPLYVLDEKSIINRCKVFSDALATYYPNSLPLYASKANITIGLLSLIADQGFGVDVVSGGEMMTAIRSRVNSSKILLHGNNKSDDELVLAMEYESRIVIDNTDEFHRLGALAKERSLSTRILFRIKPGIEVNTHRYIQTGQDESKFGMTFEEAVQLIRLLDTYPELEFLGFHAHIGSQIFDIPPYEELVKVMVSYIKQLKEDENLNVMELNLGGGFGVQYTESDPDVDYSEFVKVIGTTLKSECEKHGVLQPFLLLEPGRAIVANAGVTLYKVGATKKVSDSRQYIFVDGGMADNPRPITYESKHTFEIASNMKAVPSTTYDIAGKYCESGDILGRDIRMPEVQKGDILVVYATGAYNYSMSSNYNRSCRPAMVLVSDGQSRVLVRRETYDDLLRLDEEI